MNKPSSLRAALEAAVPDLKKAPDKVRVFIKEGGVESTAKTRSFVYGYTVDVTILDFTGHPDALFLPILDWLRDNQPEMLQNKDLMRDGFRFEAEMLNHGAVDIAIQLKLTERVGVKEIDGKTICTHFGEPSLNGVSTTVEIIVNEEGHIV